MKKLCLLILTVFCLLVMTGCSLGQTNTPTNNKTEQTTKYTITFNSNGGSEVQSVKVEENEIIPVPAEPTKEGYYFAGWYIDDTFMQEWDFKNFTVISNLELFARWEANIPTEDTPTFDDTNKLLSAEKCNHKFVDEVCTLCETEYSPLIYSLFASTTIVYDNDTRNPYGVNINSYGSDVKVIFYIPDTTNDMYSNVSKEAFYSSYSIASSYEESYFRTKHKFMSGDITDQGHETPQVRVMDGEATVRCTTAHYILDGDGNYIGYIPNSLTSDSRVIWYGGAYTSHNDVAAYLYAFGEVPVNNNYDKNKGKSASINDWGKYGRVNIGSFSANSTKYKYQPKMPAEKGQKYTETDFGTLGNYYTGDRSQAIYNNGSRIERGAARFCFVNNKKNVDERYVFYTYNHYNDFQEYLNYDNGFSIRFGNESAVNQYCYNASDYVEGKDNPPTQRPLVTLKSLTDLLKLI